jgi:hypothetical protein
LPGSGLGRLPGGPTPIEKLDASRGDPKNLVTASEWRVRLQPALGLHDLDITAERRLLKPEDAANICGPGLADTAHGDQDVSLTNPKPVGTKCLVVNGRHNPVDKTNPNRNAIASDLGEPSWILNALLHVEIVYTTWAGVNLRSGDDSGRLRIRGSKRPGKKTSLTKGFETE